MVTVGKEAAYPWLGVVTDVWSVGMAAMKSIAAFWSSQRATKSLLSRHRRSKELSYSSICP